jgi:hypothetical protein
MDPHTNSIGEFVDAVAAAAGTRGVAAGSGDNTEVVGITIDRASYGYAKSAVVAIVGSATLASGETLTLKNIAFEHDDDSAFGSGADLTTVANAVVDTGLSGGTTHNFTKEFNVDLAGAERYVRITFTPDLSASGTDTFTLAAVMVLGGQSQLPA